jgi:adenine deaminase
MIFDDLKKPQAKLVIAGGRVRAKDGSLYPNAMPPTANIPLTLLQTVNLNLPALEFTVIAKPGKLRLIESQENQLLTGASLVDPAISEGCVIADPSRDILKIAVIERHSGRGRTGVGFIRGFNLKRGAIAGTVAHDHHNLIVIGVDDESMKTAAEAVATADGGYAVADRSTVWVLPLPVAGLMSDRPIEKVAQHYAHLIDRARELGAKLQDPFMAMSFMALEVIPSLKLTDRGLVDVESFRHVDLFV